MLIFYGDGFPTSRKNVGMYGNVYFHGRLEKDNKTEDNDLACHTKETYEEMKCRAPFTEKVAVILSQGIRKECLMFCWKAEELDVVKALIVYEDDLEAKSDAEMKYYERQEYI